MTTPEAAAPTQPAKGPYSLATAGIGGLPTRGLDDPIVAVFLVLFICGAAFHMTIFQVNLRRGKKFIMSAMTFGFCMARIVACSLRLAWSTHPHHIPLAIAANIFMSAGVLILFIVNLIFTQRVMRASHPEWAWTKAFSMAFKLYYASIVVMLIALIISVVQSFYTLSTNTRRIDRTIQLVGTTYFAVAAFLPLPLLLINRLIPKKTRVEKFGQGRFRTKIGILIFSSTLLTFGAAFKAGIAYVPRPVAHPAWYHSKAAFYCVNFLIEITIVALYAFMRIDKRFIIPNGAKGAGDYTKTEIKAEEDGSEKGINFTDRINNEEDFFGENEQQESEKVQRRDIETGISSS